MNRAVSGTLSVRETGRPLTGLKVAAARVLKDGLEILGVTLSEDLGRFRVSYAPVPGQVDLTVLVFSPKGRLIFTEAVHRAIAGAELRIQVEVPFEHAQVP